MNHGRRGINGAKKYMILWKKHIFLWDNARFSGRNTYFFEGNI